MRWLNEPVRWQADGDGLTVTADPKTDFWRVTRHAFINDNGHSYGPDVTGDFTADVRFSADYATLYDQAGLMLRVSETVWLKCGVEYVDGIQYASAVVTRDFSDWSVVPLDPSPAALWLRVQRIGTAVEVSVSTDGSAYSMIRQAYLTDAPTLHVGMMVAAPTGTGFEARFTGFTVRTAE